MSKLNSKEIPNENVKNKFRKINKKLRKKNFKFEGSEYNVFFNKNEFKFN